MLGSFNSNHPCEGKDCKDCEVCVFDEELFPNREKPNSVKSMVRKLCNGCQHLIQSNDNSLVFDAHCEKEQFQYANGTRARRIEFAVTHRQDIVAPDWCPLKDNSWKGTASETKNEEKPIDKDPKDMTYTERRTYLKTLPKRMEWEDIKEGELYVIPKIMSQARKVLKVETVNDNVCVCREISEYTGKELTYTTNIYKSDVDSVFITKYHEF